LAEPGWFVTGGPGVGKTTIVRGIVSILKRAGFSVALAAPTGRALETPPVCALSATRWAGY
jgi:ATP-dependent exoDNAse (exonuclease V) alpha subunit